MKVLLIGAAGQLGQALRQQVPAGIALIATSRRELDLADAEACRAAVAEPPSRLGARQWTRPRASLSWLRP